MLGTTVGVLSLVAGFALGAVTVSPAHETGTGTYLAGSELGYWTQVGEDNLGTVPTPVPTSLSTTVGTPSVLPASTTSYMLNTGTVGHTSVRLNYTESTSAPTSKEIELTFIIVTGTGFTSTTVTGYAETQATAPSASITFEFYFDTGTTTPVVDSVREISQQCSAVGTCP